MYAARKVLVFGVVFSLAICFAPGSLGQTLPAGPQLTVDTTFPVQSGLLTNVAAGGDLQGALDRAQPGDTILLQAGATFTGSFTLRAKSGTGWIVVRTSAPDSSLPPAGTRITPTYAGIMPKIVASSSAPAMQTAPGAHNYRFVGVEFSVVSGLSINYGIVALGDGSSLQNALSQVPYGLILDRVYIHGLTGANVRRGVGLNSGSTAVIDSYISEIHEAGADTQAIGGWNGPGPYKIANNYLEAAGENILLGGADPSIANLVPSDIEIRSNYVNKPVAWMGSTWSVKNLLELKNAQRVLVDGNIFEHNWLASQNGFAILFTVRNQNGTAPWSVVQDVTFTHNIVRHVASGVNLLGFDSPNTSQQTKRILIRDNVFDDVNTSWGGSGRLFQPLSATANVTIDHNTAFQNGDAIGCDGAASTGFVYTNNLTPNNLYGVGGSGTYGNPLATLSTYLPGAVFRRNILAGGSASSYPPDNFFPATMAAVGFADLAGGNYKLLATSTYHNAGLDGKDVGADIDALNAATANTISGAPSSPPPPPPDTTPPAVSINSPASGATVSGTTTIAAAASDNVGVAGVQFLVDSVPLGAEDTATPNQVSWDTTHATNGAHVLTAVARDAAGNRATAAAIPVTVANAPPPPMRSPYTGTPFVVPGRFEAEDFDKGGEGVAYHDVTPGNQGGLYRTMEDVDIISPYPAGYVVNNFQTGEWMEYTVNVTQSGTYRAEALVSSEFTTSQFHISVDGVDKTGAIGVPNTGLWTTFQWVGKDGVGLTSGQHILRLTADVQYFNADALRLTLTSPARAPFHGTPAAVPGRFEAEDFDTGGEGVAYHDMTPANQGGLYRMMEDVDIISPYASGYAVNNFQTGEWMEYTINVAQTGPYTVEALVSSEFATSQFHISVDGVDTTGLINVPNTGLWTTFQWVGRDGVSLTAGQHVLRLTADVQYFNVDSLRVTATPPDTTAPSVAISSPAGGATVSGLTTVAAAASDDKGIAGVQFLVDGVVANAEKTLAPYQFSWDTTRVANGSHTVTALARDAAGNRATSATVTVTVANGGRGRAHR